MFTRPFFPDHSAAQVITGNGASQAIALNNSGGSRSLLLTNIGNQTAYVKLGVAGVTASAADSLAIPAQAMLQISCDPADTHLAAFIAVGSALTVKTGSYGA